MADRLRPRDGVAKHDATTAASGSTTSDAEQPADDAATRTFTRADLEALGGEHLVQLVQKHTGSDTGTIGQQTLDRVLRNESLEQHGVGHLLESRVIGAKKPLELTDEEVRDRLAEFSAKGVVAAHLGKAIEDVTLKDFARFNEMVLDAHADAVYGKSLDELSDLDRMQLASALRNARVEAGRFTDTASESTGSAASEAASDAAAAGSTVRDAVGSVVRGIDVGAGATSGVASSGAATSDAVADSSTATGAASSAAAGSAASAAAEAASSVGTAVDDAASSRESGTASAAAGSAATQPSDTSGSQTSDTSGSQTTSSPSAATEAATADRASSNPSNTQTTSPPPTTPTEDPASTDYGQGQSMPAYDDEGFVGSLAGPEDHSRGQQDVWLMVWGNDQPVHWVNIANGHTAVYVDGQWVDTTTGQPVPAIEDYLDSGSRPATNQTDTTEQTNTEGSESDRSSEDKSGAAAEESTDDDDGDDDEEDDSGQGADATTEATGDDTSSEDDGGSEPGGAAGTPHPDQVFVDPAARAAFQETPVGKADRRMTERSIEENAPGAGVIDPPEDGGERGGSSGGPLRFIGGAIDPPDAADRYAASLSDLDEMALPNAGVIDPPDDSPTGGESGANPFGGAPGPIVGGGLRSTTARADLFADDDDTGSDGTLGDDGASLHGLADLAGSTVDDLSAFEAPVAFALGADHLAPHLDLDVDDLGDALDG